MKKVILIILSTFLLLIFTVGDKTILASEVSSNKCESTTQDNKKVEISKEKQDVDTKKNSEVPEESTSSDEVKSETKGDKDAKDKSKDKVESKVNEEKQDKDINKTDQDINKSKKKEEWVFDIKSPEENSMQYDNVDVKIGELNVDYQVKKVTAAIGCNSTDLTYVSAQGWEGKISLEGLKRGNNILKLYAVDIKGNEFTKEININVGSKPHLEIKSPFENQLVCSKLNLNVKAADVYGENCKIRVYIKDKRNYYYPMEKELPSGTNELITSIDLSKYAGENLIIEIRAINDDGVSTREDISVFVDELKGAESIDNVNGTILDYKNNKILYKTNEEKLILKDEITGNEKLIYQKNEDIICEGYITSSGVVLRVKHGDYPFCRLYEYREDTLKDLGYVDAESFKFNNNYAVWKNCDDAYFKDFSKDDVTVIYVDRLINYASLYEVYVSENGEVSLIIAISDYSKNDRKTYVYLYKYINGGLRKSSNDNEMRIFNTKSNDQFNVYLKATEKNNEQQLILNTNSYEVVLAVGDYRYLPYMFSGDYFAYKKYVNGKGEIFLIKDGVTTQVTFKSRSNLISLNQRGDVIVKTQIKSQGEFKDMYCLIKNGTNIKIPLYTLDDINVIWEGNNLYAIRGGCIVKVDYSPEKNNEAPYIKVRSFELSALKKYNLLEYVTAIDREDGDISDKIKVIKNNIDYTKPGNYSVTYSVTDRLGETTTETVSVRVNENRKPEITAYGWHIKPNECIDWLSKVTAYDYEDGDLTNKVRIIKNDVDVTKPGDYTIIYEVEDEDGQVTDKSISVVVISNTPPEIDAEDKIVNFKGYFNPYEDVHFYDKEDYDDDLNSRIVENTVDVTKPGVYKVVYKVSDRDGNVTIKEVKVTVLENEKPQIYAEDISIKVNDTIDLLSTVHAYDKEDEYAAVKIVKNNVNTKKEGVYEVVYEAQDKEGQAVDKAIKVTVRSNEKPVINAKDIIINKNEGFNELKDVTARDKEDGNITYQIKVIENTVDVTKEGKYKVKYQVTDSDGNITYKEITVIVKSNNVPVIIADDITIKAGDKFNIMDGVKASDVEDGDITNNITVIGEVDTEKAGNYIIKYSIMDSDKNKVDVYRTITVK